MDQREPLRIIQWATGSIGRYAIGAIVEDPALELAGVWVHGEAKDGQDAGHDRQHRPDWHQGDSRRRRAARHRRRLRAVRAAARGRRRNVSDPRVGEEPRHADRLLLREGSDVGGSPRGGLQEGRRLFPWQRHPSRLRGRSAAAGPERALPADRQDHDLRGLRPLAGQREPRDGHAAARLRDVRGRCGQGSRRL